MRSFQLRLKKGVGEGVVVTEGVEDAEVVGEAWQRPQARWPPTYHWTQLQVQQAMTKATAAAMAVAAAAAAATAVPRMVPMTAPVS